MKNLIAACAFMILAGQTTANAASTKLCGKLELVGCPVTARCISPYRLTQTVGNQFAVLTVPGSQAADFFNTFEGPVTVCISGELGSFNRILATEISKAISGSN